MYDKPNPPFGPVVWVWWRFTAVIEGFYISFKEGLDRVH